MDNISIIAACMLLYIPNADLKKLNKYATDEELIKVFDIICLALKISIWNIFGCFCCCNDYPYLAWGKVTIIEIT